ncbi:hypothetical protein F2Q69_00047369 [Brassica cretica]|uniref:Uncharacterized protein n=1 Tax=Brassica cretica TaxID=69181 RepID=A0A8S9Q3D4_BRACR|nr:hypothetical protein F2Q69_00047369 [Brassica cretica]
MEYFRKAINSTKGRNAKSKPPLGGVYKDVEHLFAHLLLALAENPGPQGKLGFPDFPPITEIDGVNFGSHSLALEREGRVRNNAGKTTPAAPAPMANAYANATILAK